MLYLHVLGAAYGTFSYAAGIGLKQAFAGSRATFVVRTRDSGKNDLLVRNIPKFSRLAKPLLK
jgi:hypothetical protein